jgi:hypothetical protein
VSVVEQPTRDSGHPTTDRESNRDASSIRLKSETLETRDNMVLYDVGQVISVDGLVWARAVILCRNTKVYIAALVVIGG